MKTKLMKDTAVALVAERTDELRYAHMLYCNALADWKMFRTLDLKEDLEVANRRYVRANQRLDDAERYLETFDINEVAA